MYEMIMKSRMTCFLYAILYTKKKGEPALECNALDIKMLFLELYGLLPKFRKGATKT